jgi:hypothetical protein
MRISSLRSRVVSSVARRVISRNAYVAQAPVSEAMIAVENGETAKVGYNHARARTGTGGAKPND